MVLHVPGACKLNATHGLQHELFHQLLVRCYCYQKGLGAAHCLPFVDLVALLFAASLIGQHRPNVTSMEEGANTD